MSARTKTLTVFLMNGTEEYIINSNTYEDEIMRPPDGVVVVVASHPLAISAARDLERSSSLLPDNP